MSTQISADALQLLARLHPLRQRLGAATSVPGLFADVAELACSELSFERALVVSVEPGRLTAQTSNSIPHEESDRLRRRLLAEPLKLRYDSLEAELIRQGRMPVTTRAESQLATTLQLRESVLAPIAPESRTLAILLVDRTDPVDEIDHLALTLFADYAAAALERVVLRARLGELSDDIKHLAVSATALMQEVVESPVSLPDGNGAWPAFPLMGPIGFESPNSLNDLLTAGEQRIALLLVQGRSNREIADEVIVSTETVKATVARILRKLGAANRVEAAATILRLGSSPN